MTGCRPRVLATATAVPPHALDQHAAKHVARGLFAGREDGAIDRLLPMFDHVEVDRRFLCQPVEWYLEHHPFADRNAVYQRWALELGTRAGAAALEAAALSPAEVGSVVFVSTTGLATPSLDVGLMRGLGLVDRYTHRQSMFGRGCAGGVAGLAQASDRARLDPARAVLLVVVELCSLTFRRDDVTTPNIVSSALFGDGAAAAVLVADEQGVQRGASVIGHDMVTWPGTDDLMGWDFGDDGMSVVLSKSIPALVRRELRASFDHACEQARVDPADIRHHLVHPGSAVVLDAVTDALELAPDALARSRSVLRDHGNMSAATILFILDRFLADGVADAGETVALSALGPGFSGEHLLLRW